MTPAKYRDSLASMVSSTRFVGEGGIETFCIFKKHMELPCFASFQLHSTHPQLVREWHADFYSNASRNGFGYWLGTNTWRANPDWEAKVPNANLTESWKLAVEAGIAFRTEMEQDGAPIIVCGVVGPRRDGYKLDVDHEQDTVEAYKEYHARQIVAMRDHGADVICAYTMTHVEEACGIVLAARAAGMPVTISFTVEVDGKLPSGKPLGETIEQLDRDTDSYALFYMVNCAHPTHLRPALVVNESASSSQMKQRLRGFMPNSSKKSHAELDESTVLDEGEPDQLGEDLFKVLDELGFPTPTVVAGCCGTGLPHLVSLTRAFASCCGNKV